MGTRNYVCIRGNLGRDPEIRRFQDGGRVANLTLATSEKWRDKSTGERKEHTEWHRIAVLNDGLCGIVEQYLSKGDTIEVEGQLQTRKWTDQSGQERYATEVVLKGPRATLDMIRTKRSEDGRGASAGTSGGADAPSSREILDDDIPF